MKWSSRFDFLAVVGLATLVLSASAEAALDHSSVATYGTRTFTGSGAGAPDATVDFVVIYSADGVSHEDLNVVFDGPDFADSTDDHAVNNGTGMAAFDETAQMAFLYQITGAGGVVDDLYIKDFGFTPSSAGYFNLQTLTIDGTTGTVITSEATLNPEEFVAGASFDSQDAIRWKDMDGIADLEDSSILYATFDVVGSTSWFTNYDNRLSGNGTTEASLPSPNPEPGSLALLGAAVAGFGGFRRFSRRRDAEQQP
ncbi:MAG: hypothetical protein CMJ70_19755 [Planctomycetaceae bacterium]|nr:hypothetical protein [Planctomycetaceae bacterium]